MNSAGVAITGLGAISPLGVTAGDLWAGLLAGKCGIDKITAFGTDKFPCKLAGQVRDFKIQDYVPKAFRKSTKLMCRDIQLAVAAANEAVLSSGLITKAIDPEKVNVDPKRMAINLGAGLISCDLEELAPAVAKSATGGKFDLKKWGKEGLELVTPLWLLKYLPNMPACHIGIIHDIQGPSNTITCAEVASYLAISEASQIISRGDSDIALAGGAEAKVNPIVMIRQCLINRANTVDCDNPEGSCRPFDANAKGSVFGEAAGVIILENINHAKNRGTKIYAEIAGTGCSNSINPALEKLEKSGKGVQTAIEKALADAGIKPDQLDLIIPHGTGIPADDLAEAKAIEAVLGDAATEIPVWPTKSMLSNTGAACGVLDVIAAVYAMNNSVIPAAKNYDNKPDGCRLNISSSKQSKNMKYVLCCGYTYGGQTAAVVLKKT